ncbi:hypothetical protein OROMI_006846 [Orobanche minor]
MAEVEGKYVDDGEYWVADYVMGMDISDFVRECGDKIFRTSILVFEMLKALVEGWNGLSDVERKKAKDAIIQDTTSKRCKRFKLDKATSPSFIAAANFLLAIYHSQAVRSFIARREKELTAKMESAGALRTVVENSRAKIEELEN